SSSASRPSRVEASEVMAGDQAIGPAIGGGPPPGRRAVARCPIMESDRRTFLRSLLAGGVVAGGGFGRLARAQARSGPPGGRIAVLPISVSPDRARAAEVRLPFPATHVALRWRGSEDDAVEIR